MANTNSRKKRPAAEGDRKRLYGEFPDYNTRLRVWDQGNPKRPGTQCWRRFEAYMAAKPKTVGEFLKYGTREDVRWDLARGYIILDPDPRYVDE